MVTMMEMAMVAMAMAAATTEHMTTAICCLELTNVGVDGIKYCHVDVDE